jgi:hypothetical protein
MVEWAGVEHMLKVGDHAGPRDTQMGSCGKKTRFFSCTSDLNALRDHQVRLGGSLSKWA